jgi:PKD repeat protein
MILKYSLKSLALLLILTNVLTSCTKSEGTSTTTPQSNTKNPVTPPAPTPPSASFTYSGANTFAPDNVTFTNNSTNATSYSWSFGDNTSSTLSDPSHVFESAGVYTVSLIATGANALTNTISQTINVKPKATKCELDTIIVENITTQPSYTSSNTFTGKIVITKVSDNTKLLTTSAYTFGVIPKNSYVIKNTSNIYIFTDVQIGTIYKIELIQPASIIPIQLERSLGFIPFSPSLVMIGASAYPTSIPLNYNGTAMTIKVKWLE